MQKIKNAGNDCEHSQLKYLKIALSIIVLISSSAFALDPWLNAFAQQQQQQQQQPQNTGSLVNSICQLVQGNSLISGLVGLDQALNICNNLNSIGSSQALAQLCSIVGGLNVVNLDAYCNQQTLGQASPLNENNVMPNSRGGTEGNNHGNTENPPSNSITDRILGLLLGFLNF